MLPGHLNIQMQQVGVVRHSTAVIRKVGNRRTRVAAFVAEIKTKTAIEHDSQFVGLDTLFDAFIGQSETTRLTEEVS